MAKKKQTTPTAPIYIDVFINEGNKYECLCDVPQDERIYEEDCKDHANSMMLECPTKKSADAFINEFKDTHVLYAVGTPEEK